MPYKDPEKNKEYQRIYQNAYSKIPKVRKKIREREKKRMAKKSYRDKRNKNRRMAYRHNPDEKRRRLENTKRVRNKAKIKLVYHYTKGKMACECCRESDMEFLTFDHIIGFGRKHKKEIGEKNILPWLIRNNHPKGFQILCYNCNCAKRTNSICPHKLPKQLRLKNQVETVLQELKGKKIIKKYQLSLGNINEN